MEFEIKNMGLTIAVGGLAFGGVYLTLLLLKFKPFKLMPREIGDGHKFLVAAVGLAIIFGSGVLLEGITQTVTAGHATTMTFRFLNRVSPHWWIRTRICAFRFSSMLPMRFE